MGKSIKRAGRASIELVKGSVILGVGSSIAIQSGGSAAGLSAAASFMPTMGVAIGGGLVVGQLRKLQKVSKRKG